MSLAIIYYQIALVFCALPLLLESVDSATPPVAEGRYLLRFGPDQGPKSDIPNGTNLGLFKISFRTFWRTAPKCTDTDLKKSQIFPFGVNLALFISNPDTPARRLCLYGAKCDVTRDAGS